jgi:hypothetical protein
MAQYSPPPPPPQYPPPQQYYYQAPPPQPGGSTSGWAVFSLISGILAWVGVFGLGGIAAVIAGSIAKNEIRNSGGRVGGDGMATAGLVLGWLNIALAVCSICFFILMMTGTVAAPAVCLPYMNEFSTSFTTIP